jgi:hypothetical protein
MTIILFRYSISNKKYATVLFKVTAMLLCCEDLLNVPCWNWNVSYNSNFQKTNFSFCLIKRPQRKTKQKTPPTGKNAVTI